MAANRNGSGYDISSQNYFIELSSHLLEPIEPVRRQAVSLARSKLKWQAFEYLLSRANLESKSLPPKLKFKGHITRALDGTSFFTPRTNDLLMHFSPRNTTSEEGETHYPYGLCVTAINVFTGQPVGAVVDDYKTSERELLCRLIDQFEPGALALLDRGLGGAQVYLDFNRHSQFFIHRTKTTGKHVAGYVQRFLSSGKNQTKTEVVVVDDHAPGKKITLNLRLILGPKDSEGKPIVFVTNLLDRKQYPRNEILGLYRKRWSIETLYGRSKNLLCLEKFHAQTYNGVMQEIFANFLILSLTAITVTAVIAVNDLNPEVKLPSFKNAVESVRRHLFSIIDNKIEGLRPQEVMEQMMAEVERIMYPLRPGRSHPRVSKQPIKPWNLKKSAKIKAYNAQKKLKISPSVGC